MITFMSLVASIFSTLFIFAVLSMVTFTGQRRAGAVYSMLGPDIILRTFGDLFFYAQVELFGTYQDNIAKILSLFGCILILLASVINKKEFHLKTYVKTF